MNRRQFLKAAGMVGASSAIPLPLFGGLFPYAIFHERGCGGIAFRLKSRPLNGDLLCAADVSGPNGELIDDGSIIVCCSCGSPDGLMLNADSVRFVGAFRE